MTSPSESPIAPSSNYLRLAGALCLALLTATIAAFTLLGIAQDLLFLPYDLTHRSSEALIGMLLVSIARTTCLCVLVVVFFILTRNVYNPQK